MFEEIYVSSILYDDGEFTDLENVYASDGDCAVNSSTTGTTLYVGMFDDGNDEYADKKSKVISGSTLTDYTYGSPTDNWGSADILSSISGGFMSYQRIGMSIESGLVQDSEMGSSIGSAFVGKTIVGLEVVVRAKIESSKINVDSVLLKVYYESSTGWVSPGTVVSDDTIGLAAWSNPGNAKTSNNVVAKVDSSGPVDVHSHYLKATDFGFDIPSGATIDGIQISIEMYCGYDLGDQPKENRVRIVKSDGSIGTTERATGAVIPDPEDTVLYGGSNDLWGETWASSDINDLDFGVVFAGVMFADMGQEICVDHIQIKVYYTESSGTGANSERGLYIKGGKYYSRESSASLGTDDSNLSTIFNEQDYTDVGTDDDTYVDLEGIAQYFEFLFKEPNANGNNTDDFKITWKGKSSLAPSSSTVYLQIYNRTTESWETLDSDNTTAVNTKFTLEGTLE